MTPAELGKVDVLVIGAGNAAANAALSAHEAGASVAMIETAPKDARGGNSAFTGGAFRFKYSSVDDLLRLAPDIADLDLANIDFGSYTRRPVLRRHGPADRIPLRSRPDRGADRQQLRGRRCGCASMACGFSRRSGARRSRWTASSSSGADWRATSWAAASILSRRCTTRSERLGIPVLYETTATALLRGDARVDGVRVRTGSGSTICAPRRWCSRAAGSNRMPEMRARYLGPNWDLAKVRGTEYNTGIGHRMAIDIGAAVAGHWSGAHAVQWDMNAPPYGDLTVGDRFQKHNYPFGVLVNARGERFLDEGLDFHSYTYAKYGARGDEAARPVRLADLRPEDRRTCCARNTASRASPRSRRTRSRRWRRS